MKKLIRLLFVFIFFLVACHDDELKPAEDSSEKPETSKDSIIKEQPVVQTPIPAPQYYYPPITENIWETISPDSLGWDTDSLAHLLTYLKNKNTYGFLIIHKGRIVTEKYWNDWSATTSFPIASAGKSVTAFLIGVAQTEGLLDINKKTSTYLGQGWSSAALEKENLITVRHQLTMTTGLDESEDSCLEPKCLVYKTDAGTRWAYHNASYNLLNKVIEQTSGLSIDAYTKGRLADKIGLRNWGWENHILSMSTRDMARFGLLALNKGSWNGAPILNDSTYFNAMVSSSNDFNKSYGYLWWLNGKSSYIIPAEEKDVVPGPLTPGAPLDMFAAMGKGDKKIYVVPSLDLVIVRHGDDTGEHTFGPSSFDSELWKRLKGVIKFI